MDDEPLIGQRVWYPVEWEEATLDSVLHGVRGEIIAYILKRDNGRFIAIDNQMRELEGYDE